MSVRRLGLAMLAIALLFGIAALIDLDGLVTSVFYTDRGEEPWPLGELRFWILVDRYGEIPGLLMAAVAAFILFRSRGDEGLASRRRQCWLLILLVVLGAGVVVHGLKAGWGRPRPRNVWHWQNPARYREWWQPGGPGAGTGFPSGHVALSVALVAGVVVGSRGRGSVFRATVISLAVCFALLVSLSRLLDGAHHATDVLWSWVLMLMLWWGLASLLPRPPPSPAVDSRGVGDAR